MSQPSSPDDPLVRRWVERWRCAGQELEQIRRAEIESADTREAVRQIFGSYVAPVAAPATSGLVEQQFWFARVRDTRRMP